MMKRARTMSVVWLSYTYKFKNSPVSRIFVAKNVEIAAALSVKLKFISKKIFIAPMMKVSQKSTLSSTWYNFAFKNKQNEKMIKKLPTKSIQKLL